MGVPAGVGPHHLLVAEARVLALAAGRGAAVAGPHQNAVRRTLVATPAQPLMRERIFRGQAHVEYAALVVNRVLRRVGIVPEFVTPVLLEFVSVVFWCVLFADVMVLAASFNGVAVPGSRATDRRKAHNSL